MPEKIRRNHKIPEKWVNWKEAAWKRKSIGLELMVLIKIKRKIKKLNVLANWKRFTDLLPSVKSKNSGLEDFYEMFQAEIILETYLDQLGGKFVFSKNKI